MFSLDLFGYCVSRHVVNRCVIDIVVHLLSPIVILQDVPCHLAQYRVMGS